MNMKRPSGSPRNKSPLKRLKSAKALSSPPKSNHLRRAATLSGSGPIPEVSPLRLPDSPEQLTSPKEESPKNPGKISWSGLQLFKAVMHESFDESALDNDSLPQKKVISGVTLDPMALLERKYKTNFALESPKAKLHPVKTVSTFRSWKQLPDVEPRRSKSLSGTIFSRLEKKTESGSLHDLLTELKGETNEDLEKSFTRNDFGIQSELNSTEFEDDLTSDFSSDLDMNEIDQKMGVLNQQTTQNKLEIQETSLSVNKKEIDGQNGSTESKIFLENVFKTREASIETALSDPLSSVSPAKSLISRPWLWRFEIMGSRDTTYSSSHKPQRILQVRDAQGSKRSIIVRGPWLLTSFSPGEIIHIIGINPSVVDEDQNLLILNPDTLILATALSDLITCERRSVLNARFSGPGDISVPLIVGNIVHEVLQLCMVEARADHDFIQKNVQERVNANRVEIEAMGESQALVEAKCMEHADYIQKWVQSHVLRPDGTTATATRGKVAFYVSNVIDVEENVWLPVFGLKGLIDATVEISSPNRKEVAIGPLEIKTGRAYILHGAQSLLYTLLMKDRYDLDVDFYVLLYTKSQECEKKNVLKIDLRMLMVKRNSLLKHMKELKETVPELVRSSACDYCYTRDLCMMYTKLADDEGAKNSGFDEFDAVTGHMTPADSAFYKHWEKLLNLEENFILKVAKELWIFNGLERENINGKAIGGLLIKEVLFDEDLGKYTYTFVRENKSSDLNALTHSNVLPYDQIMVSDEKGHFALSTGFVSTVRADSITIQTYRRFDVSGLKKSGFSLKNQVFESVVSTQQTQAFTAQIQPSHIHDGITYRIDKNPTSTGLKLARYNLLEIFLLDSNGLLRDVLVHKRRRTRAVTECATPSENSEFNQDQNDAVARCLTTHDFRLVLGMPGTGKTTVIAEMVLQIAAQGKTVLLAAYTHSAVDNILVKLRDRGMTDFVRLGMVGRVHREVHDFCPGSSASLLAYTSPKVVATTCLGVSDWLFRYRRFDYCIVDEASQAAMPVCLGPLRFSDRFVLVGDQHQLPPLVLEPRARAGLSQSLFSILADAFPESVSELRDQYRMCADIMLLSNKLVYGGRLRCGNESVASRRMELDTAKVSSLPEPWLKGILDPSSRVVFLNHDNFKLYERVSGDKVDNPGEADLICKVVETMLECGALEKDIGVLSLYKAQIRQFARKLHKHKGLEILTADRFQGLDRECVIISLVRSNIGKNAGELMREWRRVNVALTRAKSKLIVVGSRKTVAGVNTMGEFLRIVDEKGWIMDVSGDASDYGHANKQESEKKKVSRGKVGERLLEGHLLAQNLLEDII